jgi:hypothetical protein
VFYKKKLIIFTSNHGSQLSSRPDYREKTLSSLIPPLPRVCQPPRAMSSVPKKTFTSCDLDALASASLTLASAHTVAQPLLSSHPRTRCLLRRRRQSPSPRPPRSRSSDSWKPRLWTPPHHPGQLNNPTRTLRLRRSPPQIPHPSHGRRAQPLPPCHAAAVVDMMPAPAAFTFSE